MERFNPITDLQPTDPVSVPTADISDEIESLRLRLIQTKKETNNVVNIIKDKNNSLNSDLKKIKNLNRRLNITIPRIPSMPGEAGVQFGEEVEQEKRRKRLGIRLPPRLPLIRFPSKVPSRVPQFKRAKLQKVVSTIKKPLDIYGFARGAKTGINLAKSKTLRKQVAKVYKKSQPLELPAKPIRPLKKTVSKGKGASTGGNVFTKTVNRVKKFLSPKKNEVPLNTAERMRIADLARKNFPTTSQSGILRSRRNVSLKRDLLNLEKKIPEFEIFQFMKRAKLKSPTLLKSNLNKTYTKEYNQIMKAYKQNKIGVSDMLEQTDNLRKAYQPNVLRIDRYGEEIMAVFEKFKMRGVGINKTKSQFKMDDVLEGITKIKKEVPKSLDGKKLKSGTFRYNKNKSRVNAKSMTNDIVMLNTDTSVTNTVIILTDPPIA